MSSFGRWYEEKKNEENGDTAARGSWFDTEQLLPMFSSENLQPISWSSMKASMENQMPNKILGMGYQQRFKVRCFKRASLKNCDGENESDPIFSRFQ
jgi:hypothetical protein